ncbi:MAG: Ppx/GppA phosphatase family protein [Balneolaceae bacterium]|nr:Ppx/GppA phosphatase family protein [Balneolaceae bacterium]
MKYAAIDIGSNTVLLLVAKVEKGELQTLFEEQRIPRLGKGVDSSGNLSPDSMKKAIQALVDYKNIIENTYGETLQTIVTATSAVRDANNRERFLARIKDCTGFDVNLLSGDDEAQYTFAGALSTLKNHNSNALIIDIGGGSTELCFGNSRQIIDRHSFQMGSVRFTEKYLPANIPSYEQVQNCRYEITRLLNNRDLNIKSGTTLIGVAGTVTSLAHIIGGNKEYNSESLNGISLNINKVAEVINRFIERGSNYFLEEYPVVMQGRSDVFLAGLLILEEVMKHYGFEELIVSTGGIRHGAILKYFL